MIRPQRFSFLPPSPPVARRPGGQPGARPASSTQPIPAREDGMTLLEAMIALAIMAIVAVVAVNAASQLQSAFSTGQSKGASEQLAAGIRSARQLAITIARDVCLGMGGTSYHYHYGGRSAAACTGANVPQEEGGGVVTLTQGATVATAAFVFTPVSTVDPVGPTSVAVTATNPNTGSTCSVNVTVTAAGGVQLAPPAC